MRKMSEILEFALDISQKAGEVIKTAFYKEKQVTEKECIADLVTESDIAVEKLVKDTILSKFPDHKFIGEESVSEGNSVEFTDSPTWIIDPIDGTSNFISGYPFCCISMGYYVNKQAQVAVVYNPILNELFYANRGGGAFLNGKPIHVTNVSKLSEAIVITDFGTLRDENILDTKAKTFRTLIGAVRGIRMMGSAALAICYIAAGRGDAYFEFGPHIWDFAAASLIVEEAGGCMASTDGSPMDLLDRKAMFASCQPLIDNLVPLIDQLDYKRD